MSFKQALLAIAVAASTWQPALAATVAVPYTVTFDATWSQATHPGAYPGGAHFSSPIGGVHNSHASFWTPGQLASRGIEQMAETGGTSILRSEIQTAINAGTAASVFSGGGISSPGKTTLRFDVSEAFPLVTLVTMVAPSPDWFVGVHDLDLRSGGGWQDRVVVDLFSYDAGSDDGVNFTSPDIEPAVHHPVELLGAPFLASHPRLGTFTFMKIAADFDGNSIVNAADVAVWNTGFGLATGATRALGDANGDGAVDGSDLLVLQRELAASAARLPVVGSVPEPTAGGLAAFAFAASCPYRSAFRRRVATHI